MSGAAQALAGMCVLYLYRVWHFIVIVCVSARTDRTNDLYKNV